MFKIGEKWYNKTITELQEKVEKERHLFYGEHYAVFKQDYCTRMKKAGYEIDAKGNFLDYRNSATGVQTTGMTIEDTFIAKNIVGEVENIYRDFVVGETPQTSSTNNTENVFLIEEIQPKFESILLIGLILQGIHGVCYIKTRIEEDVLKIDILENEKVLIVPNSKNRNEIDYILYWYFEQGEKENEKVLYTEKHYKGKIILQNYNVISDIIQKSIFEDEQETGIDDFLIQPCFNKFCDSLIQGASDYSNTVISLQKEFDIRLSQVAQSMDKTQNPAMQVPESLFRKDPLTGKLYADVIGRALPAQEGDKEAKFIEYEGDYATIIQYLEFVETKLLEEFGLNKLIFDMAKTGQAPSGTSMKKLFMRMIAKCVMKKNQWDALIKKVASIAYQLKEEKMLEEKVEIKWYEGLPIDKKEEAELATIRLNQGTQSFVEAIMIQDNLTEEQAEKKFEKILEEKKLVVASETVLPNFGTITEGETEE